MERTIKLRDDYKPMKTKGRWVELEPGHLFDGYLLAKIARGLGPEPKIVIRPATEEEQTSKTLRNIWARPGKDLRLPANRLPGSHPCPIFVVDVRQGRTVFTLWSHPKGAVLPHIDTRESDPNRFRDHSVHYTDTHSWNKRTLQKALVRAEKALSAAEVVAA